MLSIGSLFSGIGGLELGLERAGLGPVKWQVEIDGFCQTVLAKNWPLVERFADVRTVGAATLADVDLICGGFPCQDLSCANTRGAGLAGERSGLWWEYERLLDELRPAWVVIENPHHKWRSWVPVVRQCLGRLGYPSLPLVLRAGDLGAPHERARCFVVAGPADALRHALWQQPRRRRRQSRSGEACAPDATSKRGGRPRSDQAGARRQARRRDVADADVSWEQQPSGPLREVRRWVGDCAWWAAEPAVAPLVHGLSARVARRVRAASEKALGNSVVPLCAEAVGRLIVAVLEAEVE